MLAEVPIDSTGGWIWFAFTCLVGLIWLRRHIDIALGKREKVLTEADAGTPLARTPAESAGADEEALKSAAARSRAPSSRRDSPPECGLPRLSVLVAAKDEAANIGRCIEGLRAQDYADVELIFINDRSTDATPAILDAAAASDDRITALHVRELPDGWFGKNNAMRCGAARSTGEWLCFSDADCAFESRRVLSAAMKYAIREGVDLLSVLPRLEAHTFWERVVQPVAGAVLVFWFPPRRVNSPRFSAAYANGAFMLMSRVAYDAIDGHNAVRTQVNEDMHMARLVKQAGRTLRVVRSRGLYSVRMYTGFRQIWNGWSRIFYGCFGTLPRLVVSLIFLSLFSLSPYLTLLLSPLAGDAALWFAAAAAGAALAQQSVLWRFWSMQGVPAPWALAYPLGAAICLGITVNALLKVVGVTRTTWRGTTYRGDHVEQPGRPGSTAENPSRSEPAAIPSPELH